MSAAGLIERTTTDRRRTTTERSMPPIGSRRRPAATWWPILIAAAMAASVVTVAERLEPTASGPDDGPSSVAAAPTDVTTTSPAPATAAATNTAPATRSSTLAAPRSAAGPLGPNASTVAALAVDGIDLRLVAGTASITVGSAAPVELTTTRIGNLVVADAPPPVVEQHDGEAANVWPDVTEWYRDLASGFEHGYTIERPVHGGDTLTVHIAVGGAEVVDVDGDVMLARDDEAPLWYRGLQVFDATGTTLPAVMSATGATITIEVATDGATYPITIDPTITEDQAIRGPSAESAFGTSVAVDGDRMAVGVPDVVNVDALGPGISTFGAVYLYERSGRGAPWELDEVIVNPSVTYSEFGWSVALAGDRLAIGSPNSVAGDNADAGRVQLHETDGTNWVLLDELEPGEAGSYGFGFAVDFATPDFLVIGAPGLVGNDVYGPGQAFEYRDGTVGLIPTGPVTGDAWTGYAVAADVRPGGGYRIAVGAPGENLYRVFDDTGAGFAWPPVDELGGSEMGNAVDVSGDRIAFATTNNVTIRSTADGGESWSNELITSVPRGAYPGTAFNHHFDLDHGTLAVGAPTSNQVELFRFNGVDWGGPVLGSGVDRLEPTGASANDRAGFSVALDGPSLVVGAPGDDGLGDAEPQAGAVFAVDVPLVATFVDDTDFADWNEPANWDGGVVPGGQDVAIIPVDRYPQVNDASAVDGLVTLGQLRVLEGLDVSTRIEIGPIGGIDVASSPPALLSVPATVGLDGYLEGNMRATGATSITGSGDITNTGVFEKTGPGVLTVGPGITWGTQPLSELVVSGGGVDMQTTNFDADGRTRVAVGSQISFAGDLALTGTSVIEIELEPASVTSGRITVAGTLTQAGTLVATNASGTDPTDVYEIITCGICSGGLGFTTQTLDSLDLVQSETSITLRTIDNKITAPTSGGTSFGRQIDVDGDRAAVGEPGANTVYVLARDAGTGEWTIAQELTGGAGFGRAVAISGTSLVVVADGSMTWYEYDGSSYGNPAVGGISVPGGVDWMAGKTLSVANGQQVQIFDLDTSMIEFFDDPAGLSGSAELGHDVAFGGDVAGGEGYAVVSAPGDDIVLVYEQNGGTWNANEIVLNNPSTSTPARFGESVAMSGSTVVIGEPLNDETDGDAGAVWVYDTPSDPTPQRLEASDAGSGNVFGSAVAFDGDTIVVGSAAGEEQGVPYRDGAAYVFETTGGVWAETLVLRAGDGFNNDRFGDAVGVSGDAVLVGAPFDTNSNGFQAGAVYTFVAAPPVVPPGLTFDFEVAAGSGTVVLGSSVSVNDIDRRTTTRATSGSTLAAASLASIRSDDPQATALAQIAVGSTPLSSIVLESVPLSSIPLVLIDIEGGWARIIAGSELENEPLASLTFGQVLAEGSPTEASSPAGRFAATPLSSIDVDGTPLSSIPLSSIVLGGTPLSSIPLSSIDPDLDWCDVIAELIPAGETCQDVLDELTLMEVSLRGVPLSSIPLSSIPLSSIPLSSIPLSSIPLSSIDLARSPLSSIPLSSIDLAGTPLSSIPLSSIPLSSIPLSSIPLSSIPLSSIELVGTPLSSIPTSVPLSSIDLRGAPLSSIPLSSIVLADVPLSSIPLSSIQVDTNGTVDAQAALAAWCAALAGSGYDCTSGVNATTTLRELSVHGVPLSSIPLSSIALSSIDVAGTPLSSIPLSSIPLSSIPLSSIPLSSILIGSTPLSSIPLSSIDVIGSPLSSIPLSSIDLDATPLSSIPLSSIPLSSIPLSSIPLSSILIGSTPLSSIPLSSIDVIGSPLSSIPLSSIPGGSIDCTRVDCGSGTLGDAVSARAVIAGTTIGILQGVPAAALFADLAAALTPEARTQLLAAIEASPLTLTDLLGLDGLLLGDLPAALLTALTLGDLGEGLTEVTFADLIGASLLDPATGEPFADLAGGLRDAVDGQNLTLGQLLFLGDLTVGDLLDGFTGQLTLLDIEPVLGFISVAALETALGIDLALGTVTLGQLSPEQLGDLSITDLLALIGDLELGELLGAIDAQLAGYTLGDLLLALIDPGSLAFGGVEFADVTGAELPPGTVPATSFEAAFTMAGAQSRRVAIEILMPVGASYSPGSASVAMVPPVGPPSSVAIEPVVDGRQLEWSATAEPGTEYTIGFDVVTSPRLGVTSLDGRARIAGTDVVVPATASVTVAEGAEPNDFPEPDVVEAAEGFVYLTYISTPTDNDVFAVDLAENDRLVVQMSNLSSDLDLAVWGRPSDPTTGIALSGTSAEPPLDPLTDPDADASAAEPLDDFRRLDALDPTVSLIGVANRSGTGTESLTTDRLPAGRYFVQVYGSNGATNDRPAALQLAIIDADDVPECAAIGATPSGIATGSAPAIGPEVNTLILLNESRLERFHGAAGRQQVSAALDELTDYLSTPGSSIVPAVVSVDGVPAVDAAYDAWDTDATCDPGSANDVVSAINTHVIDPVRGQLDHVVFLGADEQIPMARLTDATGVANEYDYRHEFDGDIAGAGPDTRNTFTSSFWSSTILSDEPYGDSDARSLGNRYFYVTDIALGRVVESPADIAGALTTFVEYEGTLAIDTAAVLGYDFLIDGSEQIAATLADELTPGAVDDRLADGLVDATGSPWDRADATAVLAAVAGNSLVSLNAHFDHYRALPAVGDKVPGFLDNLIAETVADDLGEQALLRSLVFSMGCHSGLSVSDVTIANTNTDWAEVLGQQGAMFVGNTGFGYGDTETVAYTELLMALFAEQVTAPFDLTGGGDSTTVGQALAWAKNEYVSGLQSFSVYDEKAVMESTFYGLPFYTVGIPGNVLADAPDPAPGAPAGGERLELLDAVNTPNQTPTGTYFSNPGPDGDELVIVAPGRPIQPKVVIDVSADDAVARGALIESMSSTWEDLPDPVIAQPIFDEAAGQPGAETGDVVFPAKPLRITTSTGPAGRRQQLVVASGQYRSDPGEQRLDDDIEVTVYYGAPGGDVTPPTITNVRPVIDGDMLTVTVDVTDDNDVDRVVVLVGERTAQRAADWTALELARNGSTWSGSRSLASSTVGVELLVQAKDEFGNVGVTTNKARNFADEVVFAEPEPTDPDVVLDLSVAVTGTAGAGGWYDGPVSITPTGSNAISVSIDGGAPQQTSSGVAVPITGGGRHTWKATTDVGEVRTGQVRIDDDGPPEIDIALPANDDDEFPVGTTARFDVRCADLSLATCVSSLNGVPITPGSPVPTQPGDYTLRVRATDAVGNVTTVTRPFRIAVVTVTGPPDLRELIGPTAPVDDDSTVSIEARFADVSGSADSYTATFDWGDDTSPSVVDVDASDEPTADALGRAVGTHVYGRPGVYAVTVTIDDGAGGTDAAEFAFVVVYDEDERGRVSGSGYYLSGREAYSGTRVVSAARFGFNAHYPRGADTPKGNTLLKLIGEFDFRSTSYDYLTVNDSMAVAEGVGTLGGSTEYRFRVQGIDQGWLDFFQITIWDPATGDVLYDNGVLYDQGDLVLLGNIKVKS